MVWRIAVTAPSVAEAKVEVVKQSATQIAAGEMPSNVPALIEAAIDAAGSGPEGMLINAFANTNTGSVGSVTIVIQPLPVPRMGS